MQYQITHRTIYDYTEPVATCHNLVHLTPRDMPGQQVIRHHLAVSPQPDMLQPQVDYFGNAMTAFALFEPHERLSITATSRIELTGERSAATPPYEPWEAVRPRLAGDLSPASLEAQQFVYDSAYIQCSSTLMDYAKASFAPGRHLLEAAMDLTARIKADFRYTPKATSLATSIEQVLQERHGVCQDFAHLMIGCLRSLGLPARYVSGYLRTDPPPGKPRLIGADASHAWVSVYSPTAGWIDFDPPNGCIPTDRHITLAWGLDFADVSPVRGVVFGGGSQRLTVSVDVAPV
jgi:transglutaminase-like putative cysteine protease